MFEYKVIPAPKKGQKAKGVKAPEERFALSIAETLNAQAAEGWEFLRAETLPSEERSGFRSTTEIYRSILVFRRAVLDAEDTETPSYIPAPAVVPEASAASAPALAADPLDTFGETSDEDDQDSSSAKA